MNDFTKEELYIIRDSLRIGTNIDFNRKLYDVYHKILGLIDNYCEHEWKHRYDFSEYDECLKCEVCKLCEL